mmetsp:Transcript_4276/g.11899  ORF Transcript_4276/g.11899 Transcript_4276/m.11899 type:complete len:345 (-) Transcript_4276:1912-2946(-)
MKPRRRVLLHFLLFLPCLLLALPLLLLLLGLLEYVRELESRLSAPVAAPPLRTHVLSFIPQVDRHGLVYARVSEPPLVARLIQNHGVLHIKSRVRQHRDDRVGAIGIFVHIERTVSCRLDHGSLRILQSIQLVVGPIRQRMHGSSHGLLPHLTLIHIPRTLIVIRERSEGSNETEHVVRIEFHVGGDALANVLAEACDIHEGLLHRTYALGTARAAVQDGTYYPCRTCEEIQTGVWFAIRTRGGYVRHLEGRGDDGFGFGDLELSKVYSNGLAQTRRRSSDHSTVEAHGQMTAVGGAPSVSPRPSRAARGHAHPYQQFVQILQFTPHRLGRITHHLALQRQMTQ